MVGGYADFGIKTTRRTLDVVDLGETLSIAEKYKPTAIIHLAAETDVDRCERDPQYAYAVNSLGTYHAATAAKRLGIKLAYVSTVGIFDGTKKGAYTENDIPNPINYYGRSKYAGELMVRGMLKDYLIARVCWMFGGGPEKDQKFVAKIIRQIKGGKEIKAVRDQVGSPTFGKDLIGAIKNLLVRDARGIVNLANKGICSRYDVAREIIGVLSPRTKVVPVGLDFFGDQAPRTKNEGLRSTTTLMRPWRAALREYLDTEWEPFLRRQ